MTEVPLTRMLKGQTVFGTSGRNVVVRLFSRGKLFVVTKGRITVLQTSSEIDARRCFVTTVNEIPRGVRPPKKKKIPIIYRAGLPSLGKR
jgi:hypothetical protein